ncbi:XF1762 family protein [Micromonospora sp. NPDC048905]|uniref:XF1762 family protein n=1 Tax=Micromonospora sp. NPDC048905 TaxID=3155494 RepID=UPI0033F9350E
MTDQPETAAHHRPSRRRRARPWVRPISYRQACAYISAHHQQLERPQGHSFSLGLTDHAGNLIGVAMVGRPDARHHDDGLTAEVTRLAYDGPRNACSVLLAAAWRVARRMGYQRMITYTRTDGPAADLRAAGWKVVTEAVPSALGWNRLRRRRAGRSTSDATRTHWQVTTEDWRIRTETPDRVPRRVREGQGPR